MSFKRITAFGSWLTNKWWLNLLGLPLFLHKKSQESNLDNVTYHGLAFMCIALGAMMFSSKDANGRYVVEWYWDCLFYLNILHFIYCIIMIQYNKYISELNSTLDRLKKHE